MIVALRVVSAVAVWKRSSSGHGLIIVSVTRVLTVMAPKLIGVVSYGLCALLFFGLMVKLLAHRRASKTEQALIVGVLMTAVWASANTVMFFKDSPLFLGWVDWTEVLRNLVVRRWIGPKCSPPSSETMTLMALPAHPPTETDTKNSHTRPRLSVKSTGLPSFLM